MGASVGKSKVRVDAFEKATGRAKYTDDLCGQEALIAKVVHATIANGVVRRVDTEEASFLIDLSDRPREQLAPIYQPDGTLIAPKKADVSALNVVFPSFNATTGRFELTAFQRITGLYSADLLGYLIRQMVFREGSFFPSWTLVGVTGV